MKKLFKKYQNLFKKFLGNIFRKRTSWEKKIMKFFKFLYLLLLFPLEIIGDLITFRKNFSFKKKLKPKKILIIKIDQFGDVLFSTFLLPLIKKQALKTEIHYLINPKTEILLKNNPYINKIYFWHDLFLYFILGREGDKRTKNFFEILKEDYQILKKLRNERYDLIVNTRAFAPSSNFFFKIMNPKFLSAFDISEQSFLADYWAEYDLEEEEWKNYLKLFQPFFEFENPDFSSQFYNFDDKRLRKKFSSEIDKFVVISPVSFDKERLWEINYWQELIKYLIGQNYYIILTGIESQKDYLLKIAKFFTFDKVKIFTNLTIPELASLIKYSKFVIAIDSFIAHLAIAIKKPLICLINPEIYFLKNYSKPKKFIDAKSMIPVIKNVFIFSNLNTSPIDLIKKIGKIQKYS